MEVTSQDEIKAHLLQTSDSYRQLHNQHLEYDRIVADLEARHTLTPEEELEEHRLKKLKLHLKDEMELMVSQYQPQHAG